MFLPDLLGSPMLAARGMTALTKLLPAEGHCRRFARPPQGEDTPFPKEKSGPEIFPSRFSYSVYRFRQIPNPGR